MQRNIRKLLAGKIVLFVAVVYTLFITTLSLVQLGDLSMGSFSPTDKMLHAGAYFGLAFLWLFYYLMIKPKGSTRRGDIVIALLVILFGMFIEVLQGTLTNYRQPDWADIVANTVGVILAWCIFVIFQKFLYRVKHQISSFL